MRAYQLSTINRYTVDQFNEESKIEATGKKKKSHPPSLYFVFHIPYSNMMLTVCMIPFVNFDNFCLIQLMFTKHISGLRQFIYFFYFSCTCTSIVFYQRSQVQPMASIHCVHKYNYLYSICRQLFSLFRSIVYSKKENCHSISWTSPNYIWIPGFTYVGRASSERGEWFSYCHSPRFSTWHVQPI